jgi:hypothetical protein
MSKVTDTQDPIDEETGEANQTAMAFGGKLDYGQLYHSLFFGLSFLHRSNQDERAHELFYNTIPDFGSLWDLEFVQNCDTIQKDYIDDMITCYRLHKVEFSRLMQRAGIAPKPDVRLDVQPSWEPPRDLDDLTRTEPDEPGDEDAEGDYDMDVGYVPEEGAEIETEETWEE